MKKTFCVSYHYYGAIEVEAENEDEAMDIVGDMDDDELTANAEFEFTAVNEYDEDGNLVKEHIM